MLVLEIAAGIVLGVAVLRVLALFAPPDVPDRPSDGYNDPPLHIIEAERRWSRIVRENAARLGDATVSGQKEEPKADLDMARYWENYGRMVKASTEGRTLVFDHATGDLLDPAKPKEEA